jgi:hypothetical protein
MLNIVSSQTTKGVALPYMVSVSLDDLENQKQFRQLMQDRFYYKDISIRISKYINLADIHFRNESDVAIFLLLAGEI